MFQTSSTENQNTRFMFGTFVSLMVAFMIQYGKNV